MELEGTGIRSTVVRPGMTASEFGTSWDPDATVELLKYWRQFGLQRHLGLLPADAVARAVVTVVTSPPGVHLPVVEVQPDPPKKTP